MELGHFDRFFCVVNLDPTLWVAMGVRVVNRCKSSNHFTQRGYILMRTRLLDVVVLPRYPFFGWIVTSRVQASKTVIVAASSLLRAEIMKY